MRDLANLLHRSAATLTAAACTLSPSLALACPMCFTGKDSNGWAFVAGSVFLMIVPTAAIGTLVYLAYKRMRAIDDSYAPRPVPKAEGAERPALHVVPPT